VRRWLFGPDGWSFLVCDIDFRVAALTALCGNPPSARNGHEGHLSRDHSHERISDAQVFDQDWTGGEAISTVVFTERNGRTTVDNTMLYSSREARDAVLESGMKEGMRWDTTGSSSSGDAPAGGAA
jgi:uncharacterized protein YndB with AHSA1/START domain